MTRCALTCTALFWVSVCGWAVDSVCGSPGLLQTPWWALQDVARPLSGKSFPVPKAVKNLFTATWNERTAGTNHTGERHYLALLIRDGCMAPQSPE